jgi:hypothetical protein
MAECLDPEFERAPDFIFVVRLDASKRQTDKT